MIGKVFLWTILGFLAVLFIGPLLAVLAVLATLLPFALLGYGIWLVLTGGRSCRAWPRLRRAGYRCQVATAGVVRGTTLACRRLYEVRARAWAAGRTCGAVLREVFSGAAVGVVLVLVRDMERVPSPPAILAGAALGGLAGVLVALSRLRVAHPAREYGS